MSAIEHVMLTCDLCGARHVEQTDDVADARHSVEGLGWTRRGEEDVCPAHPEQAEGTGAPCVSCGGPLTPGRLPDDGGVCPQCYAVFWQVWSEVDDDTSTAEIRRLVRARRGVVPR